MEQKRVGRRAGQARAAQKSSVRDDASSSLAFHPLANLFPLLYDDEFAELIADIKNHGLREPSWLYEDKVLDGRNRYRACRAAGVDPQFLHFSGTHDEARAFVVSANLHRRHLSPKQKREV